MSPRTWPLMGPDAGSGLGSPLNSFGTNSAVGNLALSSV